MQQKHETQKKMETTITRKTTSEYTATPQGYQPRTARVAYALAHPHTIEVVDPELRARLKSYRNRGCHAQAAT